MQSRPFTESERKSLDTLISYIEGFIKDHPDTIKKNKLDRLNTISSILTMVYNYMGVKVDVSARINDYLNKNVPLPNATDFKVANPPDPSIADVKFRNLIEKIQATPIKTGFSKKSDLKDILVNMPKNIDSEKVLRELAEIKQVTEEKQEAQRKVHARNIQNSPLYQLPQETLLHVFSFLGKKTELNVREVSHYTKNLVDIDSSKKTYLIFSNQTDQYDPVTFFNEKLIEQLNALKENKHKIYESTKDYSQDNALQSLISFTKIDGKAPKPTDYVMQINLPKVVLISLLKNADYDAILPHIRKIHPLKSTDTNKALAVNVEKQGENYTMKKQGEEKAPAIKPTRK